ncbi:MAG: NAD(P)-binding domain-containing protein [Rhizobacter sp.]|nr:NAD(P)-binding domain-containing protein [Ferruginibacter sp.]
MKIGIVGSGNMGAALGTIWSKKGHQVMFSYSKDAEKLNRLAALNSNNAQGTVEEAVAFSDVIMLSIPYSSLPEVLSNKTIFQNKTIITCISGLQPDFSGETIGLGTKLSISVAEHICHLLQITKVVEAFNTTFAEILQLPSREIEGKKPSLFFCGDDAAAKEIAATLIEDADYTPINCGGLLAARTLETLATSWVQFAVVAGLFPRIAIHSLKY